MASNEDHYTSKKKARKIAKDHYYHYTSKKNARQIAKSKKIIGSTQENHDALFGNGVYLTDMKAENYSRTQIAQNNYGPQDDSYPKLEKVIDVILPNDEVKKCDTSRQVYLYPGDLDLSKYHYSIEDANFKEEKWHFCFSFPIIDF